MTNQEPGTKVVDSVMGPIRFPDDPETPVQIFVARIRQLAKSAEFTPCDSCDHIECALVVAMQTALLKLDQAEKER